MNCRYGYPSSEELAEEFSRVRANLAQRCHDSRQSRAGISTTECHGSSGDDSALVPAWAVNTVLDPFFAAGKGIKVLALERYK